MIGVFPYMMIAASLIFFSPDWPRRLLSRLRARPRTVDRPSSSQPTTFAPSLLARLAVLLALVLLTVQIVVPLRHYFYPGPVQWNEEGYRFSWRVLLTEKGRPRRIPGHGRARPQLDRIARELPQPAPGRAHDDAARPHPRDRPLHPRPLRPTRQASQRRGGRIHELQRPRQPTAHRSRCRPRPRAAGNRSQSPGSCPRPNARATRGSWSGT